ncbi:MAG: hypothetical protein ACOYCB_13650 [Fastidiosipilaceae bacterium]
MDLPDVAADGGAGRGVRGPDPGAGGLARGEGWRGTAALDGERRGRRGRRRGGGGDREGARRGVIFKIPDMTARYPRVSLPRRSLPYIAVGAIWHVKRVSKDISQSILHTYLKES